MRTNLPKLPALGAPLLLELGRAVDLRGRFTDILRMDSLPQLLASGALQKLFDCFVIGVDCFEQVLDSFGVGLRHRNQRIQREQEFVAFFLVQVEYQHRHDSVGIDIRAKVAVHDHHDAVRHFPYQQNVRRSRSRPEAT